MTTTQIQAPEVINDGRHDFDFYYGRWRIHNHRLIGRLQGSTTWEDFEAIGECWPVLDGLGNMDEYRTEYWPNFIALTLRLFNVETRQWSIFWIPNNNVALDTPVVGSFSNGVGSFDAHETFDGKPIIVRFTWSDITPTSTRWQQAFSPDDGKTWEVNWIMTSTRLD